MKHIFLVLAMFCAPAFAHGDKKPEPTPATSSAPVPPGYRDSFDGWQRHAAISGLIGFALRNQWPDEPWRAFGWALVPGFAGELAANMDRPTNRFSWRDMASNAAGSAIGVSIGGLVVQRVGAETRVSLVIPLR